MKFIVQALASLLLLGLMTLLQPHQANAAEVLQVRSATLLQVGDHNRTYTVELACLDLPADQESAAADWLRRELPRRTRVNLRPLGNHDGNLLARVQRLDDTSDLSSGLIAAGLAAPLAQCGA